MSVATIRWIGGPVLKAAMREPFRLQEAIQVGSDGLLGEVIQLRDQGFVAQVYEDTTGLRPGDSVFGTGRPLSIPLGPGICGHIFDGLLRPLRREDGNFFRPGLGARAAGVQSFEPLLADGDTAAPGQVYGRVAGEGPGLACLIPPDVEGRIARIAPAGEYDGEAVLCEIEGPRGRRALHLAEPWPVRRPRPVRRRLAPDAPMVTGQRILDTLFPVARGSRAALPGGFGTGKTVLQESLAKWCDADVIVYVGCGERGNEMAEVLDEFPSLEDPRNGRPRMERTDIIANTATMPVAAREASIDTAITVAEYFRDQGLHVALMADSTSRGAEALREVSGRLGELPGEAGYPAYLASRLADFYERAARVETLSGEEGSVTVIGAVSPPAGDFSEPVTSHTKRYVRTFWALDRGRAHARFYPAIHPLNSYAEDVDRLAQWWQAQGNPDWTVHRRRILTLVEQEARLERMARIVGKDALPDEQQLVLLQAELINDGFLRQSSFSPVDRYCSPARQTAMLRVLMHFLELSEDALARGVHPDAILNAPVLRRLQRLGEDIGEDQLEAFAELQTELDQAMQRLIEEASHAS